MNELKEVPFSNVEYNIEALKRLGTINNVKVAMKGNPETGMLDRIVIRYDVERKGIRENAEIDMEIETKVNNDSDVLSLVLGKIYGIEAYDVQFNRF